MINRKRLREMSVPEDMTADDVKALFSLPDDDDGMHQQGIAAMTDTRSSPGTDGAPTTYEEQYRIKHHALVELYKLCRTLGSFRNGVEHNGIDEGEVYASGIFDRIEAALRQPYIPPQPIDAAQPRSACDACPDPDECAKGGCLIHAQGSPDRRALEKLIQRHASAYVARGAAISDSIIAECKASREALLAALSAAPPSPVAGEEIGQHIAWLYQYVRCMNERNWRDMRDNAERQLDRLAGVLSIPSTQEHTP